MSDSSYNDPSSSITEGWRALELFTDRREQILHFLGYLNEDPAKNTILFFLGNGGNGKSLLLQYLRKHALKRYHGAMRFVNTLRDLPSGNFRTMLEQSVTEKQVASAYVDFGMSPREQDRPQEAFSALLMIRRQLAGFGLQFPLYTFASVWYLHQTNRLTRQRLNELFPNEEKDLALALVDFFLESKWTSIANALLGVAGKHLKGHFRLYMTRRGLTEDRILEIQNMDPERELIERLPELFAQDLNAAMQNHEAPPRLVLFFDTHEAFWGQQRDAGRGAFFARDEWLRRLLLSLGLQAGIVAVVASRDSVRWNEAGRFPVAEDRIDVQGIGFLKNDDSLDYLKRALVTDTDTQSALIRYASIRPDQVHPLYLGLCADIVLQAQGQGKSLDLTQFDETTEFKQRGRVLVDRLLSYCDHEIEMAVRCLCACRAFDWSIYRVLGQALGFNYTKPSFDILLRFSFIWRAEQRGEGWYRIHDLLRQLLQTEEDVLDAHEKLEQYYRAHIQPEDPGTLIEAIYHANRQDWKRGVEEWKSQMEAVLLRSDYALGTALLGIRSKLLIHAEFDRGIISYWEGEFYAGLSLYDAAGTEYEEALSAYQFILDDNPDYVGAHNNKGLTLRSLGDLQSALSQHESALQSYGQSVAAYDEALRRAPDLVQAHNNKGLTLQSLGDLQSALSQHESALQSYGQSVAAYDEALRRAPDDVYAHNNKGLTLRSLIGQNEPEKALTLFEEALRLWSRSYQISPDARVAAAIERLKTILEPLHGEAPDVT